MNQETAPENIWITMQDFKSAGFCAKGSRNAFQLRGLSWSKFIKEGGLYINDLGVFDQPVAELYKHAKERMKGDENGPPQKK